MVVEVALGVLAHSLALLSDAAHMLIDAAALGMSVWAARLALRPPEGRMTFGFRRAEILSAQANGVTLLVLGAADRRSRRRAASPRRPTCDAPLVVATALAGRRRERARAPAGRAREPREPERRGQLPAPAHRPLRLRRHRRRRRRLWATGFERADPIASLAVAGSMLSRRWPLLRRSGRVLLEAAPEGLDPDEIGAALAATPASPTCTTCTSGRSAPASRPSRRTSSSGETRTATRSAASSRRCCTSASASTTRPSRSSTPPTALLAIQPLRTGRPDR